MIVDSTRESMRDERTDDALSSQLSRYTQSSEPAILVPAFMAYVLEEALSSGDFTVIREECIGLLTDLRDLLAKGELTREAYIESVELLSWMVAGMASPCPIPRYEPFDVVFSRFRVAAPACFAATTAILRDSVIQQEHLSKKYGRSVALPELAMVKPPGREMKPYQASEVKSLEWTT